MINSILKKVFGSSNDRTIKKCFPLVKKINKQEEYFQTLNEEEIQNKTKEFQDIYQKTKNLDNLLIDAYALVKNACRRLCGKTIEYMNKKEVWDMIPFDVQLIGGIIMHQGGIAEMQTGEGKTLTATLPLYLNALTGNNIHLVTTNDFLAERDSQWVGAIFRYLGLTVGCIKSEMPPDERKEQYACNITYATNSEFGFDYLRDMGMATSQEELVQKGHFFAIIDEVDSILIDEARTPLIISGPVENEENYFTDLKKSIFKIYKHQQELCQQKIREAKEIFNNYEVKDAKFREGIKNLALVKLGMPRNKQLLELLEISLIRRELEKEELKYHSEKHKKLIHDLKEELYFSIEERFQETSFSEKGRDFLSKEEKQGFILPDIYIQLREIDENNSLSDEKKENLKKKAHKDYETLRKKIHNISQLLKAYVLFEKDVHYIVGHGQVIIVDENTGYPMPGRRFSDGLHQALEAKENVKIEKETQTLATITIQNYFRMYKKLAGMTGTAETEATEFKDIYKLTVASIPTHKSSKRKDNHDVLYKNKRDKYTGIVEEIKKQHNTERPILVGTPTVEVSETLSILLKNAGIRHNVLNARRHEDEANIIVNAGHKGSITIATNMAGRGTDIKLGDGVKELGGLFVLGAAKHDSRRIDRQLRGRCARQGDLGETKFFISLEDELMRIFGSDRITPLLERFGFKDGENIGGRILTSLIERSQKRVEQQNFSQRKRTLEYDDVMNSQRKIIYKLRYNALINDKPRERILEILENTLTNNIIDFSKSYNFDSILENYLKEKFPFDINFDKDKKSPKELTKVICDIIIQKYTEKISDEIKQENIEEMEKYILITAIDKLWKEHLHSMDQLRQNVQFSSIAQKDPLIVYRQEAFKVFIELEKNIAEEIVKNMFTSIDELIEIENFMHNLPQEFKSDASLQEEILASQVKDFHSYAVLSNEKSNQRKKSSTKSNKKPKRKRKK